MEDVRKDVSKHYRIGEFAKKVGVSPDFLKYQEEFGVVDPLQKENSNYRYYAFAQAGRVFSSIGYQNLGFTLREIESILGSDDTQGIISRLDVKANELAESIVRFDAYRRIIDRLKAACVRADSGTPWYIEQVEPFAFLPHARRHDFVDDEESLAALRQWSEWLPVVSSAQVIKLSAKRDDSNDHQDFSWGLMVERDFAVERGLTLARPIQIVEAGRFLVYCQRIDLGNETPKDTRRTLNHILEAPLAVAADHRLNITGEVYHRILFNSHEQDSRHLNSILYLRLF
jgi:DNA-binding transcriptional MerR regulator